MADLQAQTVDVEDQLAAAAAKPGRVSGRSSQALAPAAPAHAARGVRTATRSGVAQADISRLYFAIHAARRGDRPLIVQFVGASGREGVSTIAEGLAARSAREPQSDTLVVRCGPPRDDEREALPRLLEQFGAGQALRGAPAGTGADAPPPPGEAGGGVQRAALGLSPESELDPGALAAFAEALRGAFSLIVLDCPPVESSPVSGTISRIADGTIVVVEAGRTTRRALERTTAEIARMGGEVFGFVLNKQRDHLPAWLRRRMG